MRKGFVRSSRFSPGNLLPEALSELFSARHDVLDEITNRLVSSVKGPEKHFILLIGPRGCGKTHFMALAHSKIVDELGESGDAVIAYMNEEEWGISSYLDLVLRILEAIQASPSSPDISAKIEELYAVYDKEPEYAEEHAETVLLDIVGERVLLLFLENLAEIFDALKLEGQQKWRAFIQQHGNTAILASSPKLSSTITGQNKPFFNFFTVRNLAPLNFDEAVELLTKKAVFEGDTELVELLGTPIGRARVRALHHLAGGSPRVYVVLYDFLARQSLNDVVDPFMHMIDDLTPYYQDILRQLSPLKRKIVEHLARARAAVQITEIAKRCLVTHQTATKQISELVKLGVVSKIRSGRNTYCELAEPLMRICFEVKDNRTEHLMLFVEFLRRWFSKAELSRRARFDEKDECTDIDIVYARQACKVSESLDEDVFVQALDGEAEACFRSKNYEGLLKIKSRLIDERGSAHDYYFAARAALELNRSDDAAEIAKNGIEKCPKARILYRVAALIAFTRDEDEQALSFIEEALALKPDDDSVLCMRGSILLSLGQYEKVIENEHRLLEIDKEHDHSLVRLARANLYLDDITEAKRYINRAIDTSPDSPEVWNLAGHIEEAAEDLVSAEKMFTKAIVLDPDKEINYYARGDVRFDKDNFRGAVEDFERALTDETIRSRVLCRLSDSYLYLRDYRRAIKCAEDCLTMDPDHLHANYVIGSAQIELGNYEEAKMAFAEVLESDIRNEHYFVYLAFGADALMRNGYLHDSEAYVIAATSDKQPIDLALLARVRTMLLLGKFEDALESLNLINESDRQNPVYTYLLSLVESQAREFGDIVSATVSFSENLPPEELSKVLVELNGFSEAYISTLGPSVFAKKLVSVDDEDFSVPAKQVVASIIGDMIRTANDKRFRLDNGWLDATKIVSEKAKMEEEYRNPSEILTALVDYYFLKSINGILALPKESRDFLETIGAEFTLE